MDVCIYLFGCYVTVEIESDTDCIVQLIDQIMSRKMKNECRTLLMNNIGTNEFNLICTLKSLKLLAIYESDDRLLDKR
jgi:hypothetical protein